MDLVVIRISSHHLDLRMRWISLVSEICYASSHAFCCHVYALHHCTNFVSPFANLFMLLGIQKSISIYVHGYVQIILENIQQEVYMYGLIDALMY